MGGMRSGQGNSRAALKERKDDLYETPPEAVHALVKVEKLPRKIWEPACGPGKIAKTLRQYGHTLFSTDLVDYGYGSPGVDFLMETTAPCECIVTNPPFKLAEQFVEHALYLCPRVIMLLRLAFLESERRTPILDSGQLARVHVFRKRLPMMHRDGWEGKKGNSAMAFAWFVWDKNHTGATELHRLSWEQLNVQ